MDTYFIRNKYIYILSFSFAFKTIFFFVHYNVWEFTFIYNTYFYLIWEMKHKSMICYVWRQMYCSNRTLHAYNTNDESNKWMKAIIQKNILFFCSNIYKCSTKYTITFMLYVQCIFRSWLLMLDIILQFQQIFYIIQSFYIFEFLFQFYSAVS